MYKTILNSVYVQEYVAVCREMREYFADDKIEPAALSKRYKEVLLSLRIFLDSMGCRMPNPVYPYHSEDVGTHRYLDVRVTTQPRTNRLKYLGSVPNPHYRYRK